MTARRPAIDDLRASIRDNFVSACRSLYFINPRDTAGIRPLELYPEQLAQFRVMQQQEREGRPVRICKLKSRQSGDSTFGMAWLFHKTHWVDYQRALVVAHDDFTTAGLYEMGLLFYQELPDELKHPIVKKNRRELAFAAPHGSTLMAQTAGWLDLAHGRTIQHAVLSEIDRWVNPEASLDGIWPTIPLKAGTSIIIESVAAESDGWLRHFWEACKKGQTTYTPLFTPWYAVPEFAIALPVGYEESEEDRAWQQEYGINLNQIAWYRATLADTIAKEPWGGERKHRRQYPFTDTQAFESSGFCVFPDVVLARLRAGTADAPTSSFRLIHTGGGRFEEIPVPVDEADLWVWKEPEPGRYYALGVDISDGVGQTESVVSVCAYPGYEQVAEWASNRTSVEQTAWIAAYLAERFGGSQALVIPEKNKSGVLAVHILDSIPRSFDIFRWRFLDRPASIQSVNPTYGWECVDPEAKILMDDLRWVPADLIKIGDRIMGCEERAHRPVSHLRWQTVVERKMFTAPILEVSLRNGQRTRVSSTHPFWTGRDSLGRWRWITAKDLRPGDQLKYLPMWETLRTYDAGRLSAFLDGEGHLSQGRRYGCHLLITQAEGPLAQEIRELWSEVGFPATFKWLRHKKRSHCISEKPCSVSGVVRLAEVLRALGSLRPSRLLRKFAEGVDIDRLTLNSFSSVAVEDVRLVEEGPVIGLTTDPDHTLIADGIVGHNTNVSTKPILAQVANMVFLRGDGMVRSRELYDQMTRCLDIAPAKRWSTRGRSDRVLAWLIAMIGVYLDFEGGSAGGLISENRPHEREAPMRERNQYDAEADTIFGDRRPSGVNAMIPSDVEF